MDQLTSLLLQRQMMGGPQTPPNEHTKTPQADKRWQNAMQIQAAYRNNWTPNPVLLRFAQDEKKS